MKFVTTDGWTVEVVEVKRIDITRDGLLEVVADVYGHGEEIVEDYFFTIDTGSLTVELNSILGIHEEEDPNFTPSNDELGELEEI
jgi:hypothetical protein